MFNKYISNLKAFISDHKTEAIILSIILLVGALLRLYRIDEYMTFLGDEGRDVIVVRRLLVNFDPILVGPGTSIGHMYLGPLYYYMIALPLLLFNFSPVGPSVMVAVISVITAWGIWYAIREWFPVKGGLHMPALAAAFLYSISPTAIIFGRASWNPNIMPFFVLLTIWSLWKIWNKKSFGWLIVLGGAFAFVLNSHYLGLLLLPVIGIFLVLSYLSNLSNLEKKLYLRYSALGILLFALLMSPLVLFDMRHDFRNFKAMQEFITHRDSSFKGIPEALKNIGGVYLNMFTRLVGGRDVFAGQVAALVTTILLVAVTLKNKFKIGAFWLLIAWTAIGVVGLAFMQKEIYDHYMGFLFPVPYLLMAGVGIWVVNSSKGVMKSFFVCLFVGLFLFLTIKNLNNSPLKDNPSRQLARSKIVANKIIEEAKGEKFNLAVLATSNYEDGYKYFLEVNNQNVLHADVWDKSTIADQLFVVCEEACVPTHSPKAEIANFGPSQILSKWEVGGIMLYRLGHYIIPR